MIDNVTDQEQHDEIISMLPWFVNKTLDLPDENRVALHLRSCKGCQSEVDFLKSMNEVVLADAENSYEMNSDVDQSLASVMERVDAKKNQHNSSTFKKDSLIKKLGQLFYLPSALSVPQWGVAALAGLLVAVLGVQLYSKQTDNDYTVLSSPEKIGNVTKLSVEMSVELKPHEVQTIIEQVLMDIGHQAEVETSSNGILIISLGDSIDVSNLSKVVSDLENSANVVSVSVLP